MDATIPSMGAHGREIRVHNSPWYLLRGLKPSIQQHVIISNPKKCEDLLERAKRVEAAAEITQPQAPVTTTPTDYVEETAAALRRTTLNNHRNDYSGRNNQRYSNSDRRWSQPYHNNNYARQRNQEVTPRFVCYNCNGIGHYAYQCLSHLN
ncbi:unnamed protein product [Didymodactylos carnosus]|uniref:CCHC-type domain-containing protein n=1 Tax=Didymodactylos carnosus TaxID=1234261 RepID=A0A8S2FMB1_9BILA|nr:unnamed protein product [Didymodactylos carnosus]CAF4300380.1 unnamed protein product [Didymodactylos carnosus]